jgi:transcriptional regulator with XRE-family HTH domain
MSQTSTRIRELLSARNLSVRALARQANLDRSTLARCLTEPPSRDLTVGELRAIADALNTDPASLLEHPTAVAS